MATIVVEDVSSVKKKITFEVPEDNVRSVIDTEYRDLRKTAQIKGFRRGKAPMELLKSYFKGKVEADALRKIIEQTLEPGLEEKNIKPVSIVSVDPQDLEKGKPFTFTAEVEVQPEITVTNYKGLKVKKLPLDVSEDKVQEAIERIRRYNSKLTPIPEERGAQTGDHLTLDIETELDGKPVQSLDVYDYHLEMGRDFYLPGFDEHLQGIKEEEFREITIDFPEDFAKKNIAGKKVLFRITCSEAKESVLPEFDDEFARDLGKFQDAAELKEHVRKDLQETLEQTAKRDTQQQIMDQLLGSHDFEVPDSLVEQEIDGMLRTMAETYLSQRVNIDELAINTPAQRELLRPMAIKQVRAAFIINAIATQEAIEWNEEDVDKELDRMATRFGVTKDYIRDRMAEESPASLLRSQIIQDKAYRFLEEHAEVIEHDENIESEPASEAEGAT